jgi:hypothetical protein
MNPHCRYHRADAGAAERMVPAIVLIAIGAFFLARNLQLVYFREVFAWWPALLIAFGVVKLVDSGSNQGRAFGGVILGAGGILLARNLGFIDISIRELWPLILIGVGLMMMFERTWSPGPRTPDSSTISDSELHENAVFSGGKRHITTQDFRGGKVDAVFGGYELDFRKAGISGESAVLKVDAVFGGVEIRIPQGWNAVIQGGGFFGAFTDETSHPDPAAYPNAKRFVVTGGAVFGGVNVKN